MVADGNSPDPDDIGGTAFTIALLKAAGMQNKLVHYSYCCDLERNQTNISSSEEYGRHADMKTSCTQTAGNWGFGYFNWQDAKWSKSKAVTDLKNAINAADWKNKLYIIEAGEPDIIYLALKGAKSYKYGNVKIITHHVANDDAADLYVDASRKWKGKMTLTNIVRDFKGVSVLRIPDQNTRLQKPLSDWNWAKNNKQSKIKALYKRLEVAEQDGVVSFQDGKGDASDAGMMIYWITGADKYAGRKYPTVGTMKALIER